MTRDGLRVHEVIPFVDPPALATRPRTSASPSRGSRHCQPSVSCFIATSPRSGSWFLAEALANTGRAGIPNEYFRPDFTALWSAEWGLVGNVPYQTYVEAAKERTTTANGVFSAKLHWYQFAWLRGQLVAGPEHGDGSPAETLNRWFPNLRYVFLWRRDTARQAVSYYRASVSQVWFLSGNTHHAAPAEGGLTVGDSELQQIRWFEDVMLEHRVNWRNYFAAHDITPLEVVYEDLLLDYRSVVHSVLEYLGVAESAGMDFPPPALRRQSDDQTEAILRSYLATRDRLAPKPDGLAWSAAEKRFRVGSRDGAGPECPLPGARKVPDPA